MSRHTLLTKYGKMLTIERRASPDALSMEVESLTAVQVRVRLRSVELYGLGGRVEMMEGSTSLVGCSVIANVRSCLLVVGQSE